ncbi:MAG: protein-L-isoaspartate O-methyltransferase [Legionella sp.]|nr:protein-L-isoaspartate O-methyltransferase [Legionella sp.]
MNNQSARTNMIKQQLRTGDVLDESILNLYNLIPRNEFVPEQYSQFAYSDMQIPLAHGQKMLSPLEEGKILQGLQLTGNEIVLEVGTGTGFFTALLSKLCKKLISVDYYSEFTASAGRLLQSYDCNNVTLITGDGSRGWLENAPYDVLIMTGSIPRLTETHMMQIIPGGKLFAIEGLSPIMCGNLYQLSQNETWTKSILFETDIPSLVDKQKPEVFIF